jgi:hypothetical protein
MLCKSATWKWLLPPFFLLCMAAPHAGAAVLSASVMYEEVGGPNDEVQNSPAGDLFTITNSSDIGELNSVTIALANGLLFDTDTFTDVAGTSPSFPFVSTSIDPMLVSGSAVPDGSNVLALTFSGFEPGESYSFSIDVDRTGQQNDNQNRHVIGNDLEAIFSVSFTGSFPGTVVLTQELSGNGQTAEGIVTTVVIPEPSTWMLVCSAVAPAILLTVWRKSKVGLMGKG